VAHGDALAVAAGLGARGADFDLIVIAPPYGRGLQQKALDAVSGPARLLAPGGLIVVQRERGEPACSPSGGICPAGSRNYGRTQFDFYEWARP
jgi:16S rRNA G966 N2-methylase RsmD